MHTQLARALLATSQLTSVQLVHRMFGVNQHRLYKQSSKIFANDVTVNTEHGATQSSLPFIFYGTRANRFRTALWDFQLKLKKNNVYANLCRILRKKLTTKRQRSPGSGSLVFACEAVIIIVLSGAPGLQDYRYKQKQSAT